MMNRLTPEGELDCNADVPLQSQFQKVFEFPDGSGDYSLVEYVESKPEDQVVLLELSDADVSALMQKEYPTVSEHSRKIKSILGDKTLVTTLRNFSYSSDL